MATTDQKRTKRSYYDSRQSLLWVPMTILANRVETWGRSAMAHSNCHTLWRGTTLKRYTRTFSTHHHRIQPCLLELRTSSLCVKNDVAVAANFRIVFIWHQCGHFVRRRRVVGPLFDFDVRSNGDLKYGLFCFIDNHLLPTVTESCRGGDFRRFHRETKWSLRTYVLSRMNNRNKNVQLRWL